jgi:putative phosphoesterase
MTLIGLITDVHAQPAPVAEALSIFARAGVSQIFCAGDIAGYHQQLRETIALLEDNSVQTIVGNHDLHYLAKHGDAADSRETNFLRQLPTSISTIIEGKSLYMVHAQPPDECHGGIKLLDRNGVLIPDLVDHWTKKIHAFEHDVLIVGHTHQVFAEQLGNTLVINPGSSAFNHSCAILRLPEMTVELFALSGKPVERTWNWGEYMILGKKIQSP